MKKNPESFFQDKRPMSVAIQNRNKRTEPKPFLFFLYLSTLNVRLQWVLKYTIPSWQNGVAFTMEMLYCSLYPMPVAVANQGATLWTIQAQLSKPIYLRTWPILFTRKKQNKPSFGFSFGSPSLFIIVCVCVCV